MQSLPKMRMGEILLTAGLLTEQQLEEALAEQTRSYRRFGEILIQENLVTEDDVIEAQAIQTDMPHVHLNEVTIPKEIVNLVPESLARTYTLLPVSVSADRISVALANPLDVEALDAVQRHCKKRVEPLLASESRIQAILDEMYGGAGVSDILASIEEAVSDVEVQSTEQEEMQDDDVAEARRQSGQAPVIKTVNLVLQDAVKKRASDIHFEPRASALEIRYRIDGVLQHVRDLPKALQAAVTSRIKIVSDMDISEKRKPQDGRMAMKINNKQVDLRVSTLPVQHGERVVIRVLDKSAQAFSLEKVGFSEQDLKLFEQLIRKPYGIILVTGPTGSGKTTTLYAALNHIKSVETNIITCEDPIEYELEGVNQSAVNVKAGLTFAAQLRAILRQDPDVILVGEIRDRETAEVAFQAAMTGHLVFSTLHCNSAPSAITRLLDMQVEPFLISSSIIGVLAQRLVRMLCPRCKQPYVPGIDELAALGLTGQQHKAVFHKPVGCDQCDHRGYTGRTPVIELMPVGEHLRALTITSPSSDQVREAAIATGMRTMKDHAIEKLLAGITSLEEVRRCVFIDEEAA
jgi:type IV pilus assembly protein PilB